MNFKLNVAEDDLDTEEVADDGETTLEVDGETEVEDADEVETVDDVTDDEDQEPEEDEEADEEDVSDESSESGKLPGIDVVIREAEDKIGKEAADLIRGMARSEVQQGEISAMRKELANEIADAKALKADLVRLADEEEAEEEDDGSRKLLEDADPNQLALTRALLKEEGYIKQSTLDAEAAAGLATEMDKEGVELFGETFGTWDDDKEEFILNPEIKDDLAPTYKRLVNDQNLGYRDLFVITHYDKLIEAASEAGKEMGIAEVKAANTAKVTKAKKTAKTSTRTSAGESGKQYYNPESTEASNGKGRIGSVMGNIWKDVLAST